MSFQNMFLWRNRKKNIRIPHLSEEKLMPLVKGMSVSPH